MVISEELEQGMDGLDAAAIGGSGVVVAVVPFCVIPAGIDLSEAEVVFSSEAGVVLVAVPFMVATAGFATSTTAASKVEAGVDSG